MLLIFSLIIGMTACNSGGGNTAPGNMNDLSYEYIGTYTTQDLDDINTTQLKNFSTFDISYPKAVNSVKLYRVTYSTTIPEKDNQSTIVQGLIAIPDISTQKPLPLLSYQHGTIFTKNQVPSQPDNSMETKLMIANFAGQGYVVIAADYIGQGNNNQPNAWLVKNSSVQAIYDMLLASKEVLAELDIQTDNIFLSGWSQGAYNTLAFMQKLEDVNIPVKGVSASSSANDIYLALNRWIFLPSPLDVHYLVGTAAMMVFAYENYYGLPSLSKTAIKPEFYQTAKDFYEYKISWDEAAKVLPQKTKDLFTEEFESALAAGTVDFANILDANTSYNWQYKTPVHLYYGEIDEVVTPYMAQLPVAYQKSIGGVVPTAINAGSSADHRGTFLFGIKDQKIWFDSLESSNQVTN